MNEEVTQGGGVSDSAEATPRLSKKANVSLGVKGHAGVTIRRVDGSIEHIPMHPNVITTSGFAWIAEKVYDSDSNNTETALYMGLTKDNTVYTSNNDYTVADLTAPSTPADSFGLQRKAADTETYAPGTNPTIVLKQTFTNATVDTGSAVNNIQALTLRNTLSNRNTANPGNSTLIHVVRLTNAFNLNPGDSVDVTWNIVLSEPT